MAHALFSVSGQHCFQPVPHGRRGKDVRITVTRHADSQVKSVSRKGSRAHSRSLMCEYTSTSAHTCAERAEQCCRAARADGAGPSCGVLAQAVGASERVFELLDRTPQLTEPGTLEPMGALEGGDINLQDVTCAPGPPAPRPCVSLLPLLEKDSCGR